MVETKYYMIVRTPPLVHNKEHIILNTVVIITAGKQSMGQGNNFTFHCTMTEKSNKEIRVDMWKDCGTVEYNDSFKKFLTQKWNI